jgi:hypothetical protein
MDKLKKISQLFIISLLLIIPCRLAAFESEFFTDYFSAFRFLAEKSHLNSDDNNVFKLAAESSIDKFSSEDEGELILVVNLNYYKGVYNAVRSPDGNGHFYIFLSDGDLLEYVGSMEGASYHQEDINGNFSFITSWNIGENEVIESTYQYDGDYFQRTSKILYEVKTDGSKVKVREYK